MSAETLVEALEKAGYGFPFIAHVANNADTLLPILARFASPEVKREVFRALLRERLEDFGAAVAMPNGYQTYGNGAPVHTPVKVEDVLAILAPEVPRG